ncbi:MAG: branched-chain amino acid ABC transporter permease [Acidimicrobiia bacterium]|nr:branched-chain amino acid ABC transporter permease [Acidimicrobiia bacterium]
MAARLLQQGTRQYRIYAWVTWSVFVLGVVLVAFAYADTGSIEILDNKYNIGLPRINKGISFIIAILGLQVVVGYTGQLALGQSFFFGTGAYIGAYLVQDQNWSWFSTLFVIIPACFILGFLLGIPALRIKGLYLALVTLGLAAIFPSIVQLESLKEYTDGAAGKSVEYDFVAPGWLPLDGIAGFLQSIPLIGQYFGDGDLSSKEADRIWKYTLFVILAAICFWLIANLIKSRPGRAIRAIRDNETSSAISGINLPIYKTLSFGIASALGGVGGMVYVAELGIASPGDFTQLLSILFIVGLVSGGVGTLPGAVVGGLIIAFVPEWSSSTQEIPGIPERWLQGPTGTLILGTLLIVLMFFLPGGIVAGARRIKAKVVRVVPQPPEGATAIALSGTGGAGTATVDDGDAAVDDSDDVGAPSPN